MSDGQHDSVSDVVAVSSFESNQKNIIALSNSLRDFFTSPQWAIFFFFIALGAFLRWYGLDDRALHHDESLHAMYGKYYYDNPDFRFYHYDPMLHGPLLYNTLFFIFMSFGDSEWAARFPIAVMGTASLFLPLLFRRYFIPLTVLLMTGFVAISPTLVYWSRFIREDFFSLFGMFLCLYGFAVAQGRAKSYLFFVGVALQFCSKENSYVHLAILIGYLIFEPLFTQVATKQAQSVLGSLVDYVRRYWLETLVGFLICCGIYIILYSGWGLYDQGVLDGLYRKSLSYWWNQSSEERIKGPFMFHFYVLLFYELIFILACLTQIWLFYKEAFLSIRITAIVALVVATIGWIYYGQLPTGMSQQDHIWMFPPFKVAKVKDGFDVFGIVIFLIHPMLLTAQHLMRGERKLAATGYFFTALLFTYSFLGEKVPWLTLYPFVAGIIYLALYFQDYLTRHPVPNWRTYPWGNILFWIGISLIVLGTIFMIEKPLVLGRADLDLVYPEEGGWFARVVLYLHRSNMLFVVLGFIVATIGVIDHLAMNNRLFGRVNVLYLFLVVGGVYTLRSMALTNFVYAGHEREYLSQVHTTPEALKVVNMVIDEVTLQRRGYAPHIYVTGDAIWPVTWYFRKLPTYVYDDSFDEKKRSEYFFRMEDWKEGAQPPKGYTARNFTLRGWWVPDLNSSTLKRLLHYSINHEPWNPIGFSYVNLYYRKTPEGMPLEKK
jgi:uncharacterized protein (TIGR03663 family)